MAVTHPARVRSTVPSHWNFSRFLGSVARLEGERVAVSNMIASLRAALFEKAPDFGPHLGYGGKAIASHSTGRIGKASTSEPDADWGRRETGGVNRKTGAPWKTVTSWFDYRLHLIADIRREVPVALAVTRASASEPRALPGIGKRWRQTARSPFKWPTTTGTVNPSTSAIGCETRGDVTAGRRTSGRAHLRIAGP